MSGNQTLKLDSRNRKQVKTCPCGKSNKDGKFVPFAGHEDFGFCHSCGEKFLPTFTQKREPKIHYDPAPKPIHCIPDYFIAEAAACDNTFTDFLFTRFQMEAVGSAVKLYELGTWQKSFGWPGWTNEVCFWQIDLKGRIRQVKAMRYDPTTGKRIKDDKSSYLLGSKLLKQIGIKDPNLKQCFFGEHLLPEFPDKVIGLIESEKTAIIASIMIPDILWIATGGTHGCRWYDPEVFRVMKDRRVVLYPDNDKAAQWTDRIKENKLDQIAKISICTEFHNHQTPGQENFDIADYLLSKCSDAID